MTSSKFEFRRYIKKIITLHFLQYVCLTDVITTYEELRILLTDKNSIKEKKKITNFYK